MHIWHLAVAVEWDEAVASGGPYVRSTLGKSLAEVGFIHCSFEDQVAGTAQLIYPNRSGLVLVTIETDRLDAEVIVEDGFPHIYGELPLDAVVEARPYSSGG